MTAATLAGVALAAALLSAWHPGCHQGRRLRSLRCPHSPTASAAATADHSLRPVQTIALVVVIGLAGIAFIGSVPGLVAAGLVAAFVQRLRSRPPARSTDPGQVALVLELIGGCLASGATLPQALAGCADAVDNRISELCSEAADHLRAGEPPAVAFAAWDGIGALETAARTLRRTVVSGAAAAADLRRCAARLRAHQRLTAMIRVQRVGVLVVVPLGLCFLPAFVLVAVVPLIVGLAPAW